MRKKIAGMEACSSSSCCCSPPFIIIESGIEKLTDLFGSLPEVLGGQVSLVHWAYE